jgi:hypothetical protein
LFAGLAVNEKGVALVELADCARCRVEAERQFVAVWPKASEQERIAANIGRNIDRIQQLAFVVDEHVYAFVEAHERQRHRIFSGRKDNRVKAARRGKFVGGQWNCMLADEKLRFGERAGMEIGMIDARKRDDVAIEKRQVIGGRSGHGETPDWRPQRDRGRKE